MFTSMNVLRPIVINKYNLSNFEFSHNYLYFWDILEKSNLYLEAQIKYAGKPMDDKYVTYLFKSPVGDGGVWSSFTNLAIKYGLVPKEVFTETNSSNNTTWMIRIINRKLRENGLKIRKMYANKSKTKDIETAKIKMLGDIYKILAMNLGEPPTEFTYRFVDKDDKIGEIKTYTPKSFMNEVLGDIDFSDYVMLMNDPSREYYKLYEIEYDRNVMEGINWKYINLPNDELKKFAVASIKANTAMYASCDVGKQFNGDLGYSDINNYDFESLYGIKFGMDKAQRIVTYESGSSHGMALIAVDTDGNDKPVKWQFENSWGASSGHHGYLTFTDEWFNEYMFRVVIKKEFINTKTLKILEQKPIILPPWDPMFRADD
jgi:bleomycin hydrolase